LPVAATFGALCIIDGVRAIEDGPDKGEYEIFYVKGGHRHLLNEPGGYLLHDIFNGMTARK
jgi:hypothetical protein